MDLEFLTHNFDPALCLCESEKLKEVVELSEKMSQGKNVIQLFGSGNQILKRIIPAYINAALRNYDGSMHTRSMRSEMMILVSGKMDIASALELCGARDSKFIVFSNDRRIFDSFVKKGKIRVLKEYTPSLELEVACDVAAIELKNE